MSDEPERGENGEVEYSLVLAFDTDDPEFTRGFEAGQIWERLERDGYTSQLVSAGNAEMVMRMADKHGLKFTAEDVGYEWLQVTVGEPKDRAEAD
jgi:hypothetical protein